MSSKFKVGETVILNCDVKYYDIKKGTLLTIESIKTTQVVSSCRKIFYIRELRKDNKLNRKLYNIKE